jgi:hypothetical protein
MLYATPPGPPDVFLYWLPEAPAPRFGFWFGCLGCLPAHLPQPTPHRWAEGGSFGCGDRVGILVDMDRGVAAVLLNGSFLGEAFHSLPRGTDGVQLFPAVTLAAENITAGCMLRPACCFPHASPGV